MKNLNTTLPITKMELEHDYFVCMVKTYLKRNDILKMEISYDKGKSDEIDIFWVYNPETDCDNSKIKFLRQ